MGIHNIFFCGEKKNLVDTPSYLELWAPSCLIQNTSLIDPGFDIHFTPTSKSVALFVIIRWDSELKR